MKQLSEMFYWIPAFAGMTGVLRVASVSPEDAFFSSANNSSFTICQRTSFEINKLGFFTSKEKGNKINGLANIGKIRE